MTTQSWTPLQGKSVLLGVGASIAAYRACDLIRALRRLGARVRVAPTKSATQFVTPLTFEALSAERCLGDALSLSGDGGHIEHVEAAYESDLALIAPATADLLAKMAHGFADEGLLATLLSYAGPLVVAPAMESQMWAHPATQQNVEVLLARGANFVGPSSGALASGREGVGRLAPVDAIVEAACAALSEQDLAGKRVLVTAGPTAEDIDPVRFLTNRSTGKMGVALARAAAWRGAEVQLVHGPLRCELPALPGLSAVEVRSAAQLSDAVKAQVDNVDIAIFSAAVADFRPVERAAHKRKKEDGMAQLVLERTCDVLAQTGARRQKRGSALPLLVGFAAETRDVVAEARRKLERKGCDFICANDVSTAEAGFGANENRVTLVSQRGDEVLPLMPKDALAHVILDRVRAALPEQAA